MYNYLSRILNFKALELKNERRNENKMDSIKNTQICLWVPLLVGWMALESHLSSYFPSTKWKVQPILFQAYNMMDLRWLLLYYHKCILCFPVSLVFKNVFLFFTLMLFPIYRISFPGNVDIFHLSILFQYFKASIEYILIFHRVLQDPFILI